MPPLVSIVVPTFNNQAFLVEALDTIYSQDYRPIEVIVVDDGSTDGTRSVCEKYDDLVYLYQDNSGPSAARNAGIRRSTGKYIAFLDSDDLWPAGKLRHQVQLMEEHPEVSLLSGDMRRFSGDRVSVPSMYLKSGFDRAFFGDDFYVPDAYRKIMSRGNYIPTGTVITRRDAYAKVGFFDETLRHSEDVDLWLRFALHGQVAYSTKVWLLRRDHAANLTADPEAMYLGLIEVVKKHSVRYSAEWRDLDLDRRSLLSQKYWALGLVCFSNRRYGEAREYFRKSFSEKLNLRVFAYWIWTFRPGKRRFLCILEADSGGWSKAG